MSNINNDSNNDKKLELTLTIFTNIPLEEENEFREIRLEIEEASAFSSAIFGAIERLADESNNPDEENYNIIERLAKIGAGFAEAAKDKSFKIYAAEKLIPQTDPLDANLIN
jgi:hypothetical protein